MPADHLETHLSLTHSNLGSIVRIQDIRATTTCCSLCRRHATVTRGEPASAACSSQQKCSTCTPATSTSSRITTTTCPSSSASGLETLTIDTQTYVLVFIKSFIICTFCRGMKRSRGQRTNERILFREPWCGGVGGKSF